MTGGPATFLPHGQSHLSLRTLLTALGCETRGLADAAARIEDAVAAQPGFGSGGAEAQRVLQSIDLLVQSLGAMAAYLDGLAQEADPEIMLDPRAAAARITLRDLAEALTGQRRPAAGPRVRDAGDVHLF